MFNHCLYHAQLLYELIFLPTVGTPANCTDDMISLFFENRRRSGGGDIDEFVFLEDSIVITFKSNDGMLIK